MITVRTKSSQNVKDVVRFFNRNFPEAMLKVGVVGGGEGGGMLVPTAADLRGPLIPRNGITRRCSTSSSQSTSPWLRCSARWSR